MVFKIERPCKSINSTLVGLFEATFNETVTLDSVGFGKTLKIEFASSSADNGARTVIFAEPTTNPNPHELSFTDNNENVVVSSGFKAITNGLIEEAFYCQMFEWSTEHRQLRKQKPLYLNIYRYSCP